MAARSVFTLGIFAALLAGGDALSQTIHRSQVPAGWTTKPNYDASRRSANEIVPMFSIARSQPDHFPAGTVSITELQHEIPGKAIKEWERAEKARAKGNVAAAVTHLRKAIEIDPEFLAARNNLAAILIVTGNPQEAAIQLQESIKIDPHSGMAAANLAVAYLSLRQFEAAERAARRAVDLDRTGTRPRMILGLALIMRNEFTDEAMLLLQQAQDEFPQAELLTARIFAARGEREAAVTAIENYLETGDQSGVRMAHEWLGMLRNASNTAVASR